MNKYPFQNTDVKDTFNEYPRKCREKLLQIRQIIFEIANASDSIGSITECLKWGQPSYITQQPKTGTTLRLAPINDGSEKFALLVHCQTRLIADFKEIYPDQQYDGNRAILFSLASTIPLNIIKHFIEMALTYHVQKKNKFG